MDEKILKEQGTQAAIFMPDLSSEISSIENNAETGCDLKVLTVTLTAEQKTDLLDINNGTGTINVDISELIPEGSAIADYDIIKLVIPNKNNILLISNIKIPGLFKYWSAAWYEKPVSGDNIKYIYYITATIILSGSGLKLERMLNTEQAIVTIPTNKQISLQIEPLSSGYYPVYFKNNGYGTMRVYTGTNGAKTASMCILSPANGTVKYSLDATTNKFVEVKDAYPKIVQIDVTERFDLSAYINGDGNMNESWSITSAEVTAIKSADILLFYDMYGAEARLYKTCEVDDFYYFGCGTYFKVLSAEMRVEDNTLSLTAIEI